MPKTMATDVLVQKVKQYLEQEVIFPEIVQECIAPYLNPEMFERNKVYICLPLLFSQALGNTVKEDKLVKVAAAGFLHFVSVLKIDDAFDNPKKQVDKLNLVLMVTIQEQVQRILGSFFLHNKWFWKQWTEHHNVYYQHINHPFSNNELTGASFKQYSQSIFNRNVLGLVALDAIFDPQKNSPEQYEQLKSIFNRFVLAYQLIDDARDVKEDIETGQLNYVRLAMASKLKKQETADAEELVKLFYVSGEYKKLYARAGRLLKEAQKTADAMAATTWSQALEGVMRHVKMDFYNVHGFVRALNTRVALNHIPENNARIILPPLNFRNRQIAAAARHLLKYLLVQKQNDFGELKHVIFLNKIIGLSTSRDIHVNDTFQRALISDIFCDCMSLNKNYFKALAVSELEYLKRKRQKDEIGGWSYYPGIPEIAADADDLGQILQLFIRTGNINTIPRFFEKPIQVLLEDRLHTNGGIETWIIPKNPANEKHQRQEHYNNIWGTGPDVEVMANFLYGLCLYDYPRFRNKIIRGCYYLLDNQVPGALWEPKWYYGTYYGTYTILRLFAEISAREPEFKIQYKKRFAPPIFNALVSLQKPDGGWGLNGQSDYLNTSLAALCLCSLNGNSGNPAQFKKKAREAERVLVSCNENTDYAAFNIPFIKPRVKDPYSSKTITVGYMVKALITLQNTYS
jgi:squalene-hopene/tetraprenyl-beta-curcumene cyclase